MRDLIRSLATSLSSGREVIHCQVVETKGSTPQKAGARMLVDPDGGQVGTLGGGCVEAEVKQKAIRRVGREGAEFHSFILDHDYAWADGLICGGKMVILAESLAGESSVRYVEALDALAAEGRGHTEAIVVDPDRTGLPLGLRAVFDARGTPRASLGDADASALSPPEPLEAR